MDEYKVLELEERAFTLGLPVFEASGKAGIGIQELKTELHSLISGDAGRLT